MPALWYVAPMAAHTPDGATSLPSFTPVGIKAPHGARSMEITWADGASFTLPHRTLRGYCPCAHCQGHGNRLADVGESLSVASFELRELAPVGNYALQLTWADRHDTGLYTFRFLRFLCEHESLGDIDAALAAGLHQT